ncbi:MAG: hypothetical protein RLO10_16445, partial [Roseovarius indicus]
GKSRQTARTVPGCHTTKRGHAMTDITPGLYGNDAQRRLQAVSLASLDAARATPGAVFAARMPGTDDPDRLGWNRIAATRRD